MPTLGKLTNGASTTAILDADGDNLWGSVHTPTESMVVTALSTRFAVSAGSVNWRGAIYDDVAGVITNRLAVTADANATNTTAQFNSALFTGGNRITLTAGTPYWLVNHWESPAGGNMTLYRDATANLRRTGSGDTWSDGSPATFPGPVTLSGPIDCFVTGYSIDGANYPETTANDATVGTQDWANVGSPGNAGIQDSRTSRVDLNAQTSKYLKATAFNFSIPAGSVIKGITAIITLDDGAGGVTGCIDDSSVRLTTGGSYVGDDKARAAACLIDGASTITYGGPTDTWGRTWTVAEINASTFGIGYSGAEADGIAEGIEIDYITIAIDYVSGGHSLRQLMGVGF